MNHIWGDISCSRCGVRRVAATDVYGLQWLYYGIGWLFLGRKLPGCSPVRTGAEHD
jgi:hypothetical protein